MDTKIQEKIREIQDVTGSNNDRVKARILVTELFSGLLEDSDGLVTDEILDVADELYMSYNANHLAELLGLRIGDLRLALRRERPCKCPRCEAEFTRELMPNKQPHTWLRNGFHIMHCVACEKELQEQAKAEDNKADFEWEQERAFWREQMLKEFAPYQATARLIFIACLEKQDLWDIVEYKKHIRSFGQWWVFGQRSNALFQMRQAKYSGCMVCGSEPIALCLVSHDAEKEHFFWGGMGRDGTVGKMLTNDNVDYAHEALWWLEPSAYFGYAEDLPLLRRPLLCLCGHCKQALAESFPLVYPGQFSPTS
ncbi:MAG: hypothetical protein HN413_01065 [Chloroflexi bacterium]|nr:hypothetical protein [Chloroflexota bacterium]